MNSEEGMDPQREPLQFPLDTESLDDEAEELMVHIKKVAEKLLYHWKTFPINLPPSVIDLGDESGDREQISFENLFVAPSFDELEEVAMDVNGHLKRLSEKQLLEVWKNGEFEVDSIHFPGQVHRWRLSQLLQKGCDRAHEQLLKDASLALRLLIITARNRFHSHFFSLSESLRGLGRGLWKLLDLFIGMPSTTPGNITKKVHDERTKYLVAELDLKPNCEQEWSEFCEFIKDKCSMMEMEKRKTINNDDLRPPSVPYLYQTPNGQEIDLRLLNKDLLHKCMDILDEILEQESRGWLVKYKNRLLAEIKADNKTKDDISEMLNESVMEEYLRRVYSAILNSHQLQALQADLGNLLVQQAKAIMAMMRASKKIHKKLYKYKTELMKRLQSDYPVKSKIIPWMNEQLEAFEDDFLAQNLWSAHEESIALCREQQLHQAVYFLYRDLNFMKEREPILRQELSKVKHATRAYTYSTRIWLPHNYIVRQHLYGEAIVVPTVIKDLPANITVPRRGDIETPYYTVEKYTNRKTYCRYPFWRWWNYLHRAWSWTWNAMFFLLVVIPWCSPLSIKALFLYSAFMPDLELSQDNGALCPRQSSLTHTLLSRLRKLWNHVRTSRSNFEAQPDRGFLGKSLTRHLNRIWNYVIKGAFGSTALVLFMPPAVILISLTSFAAGLAAPVWVPVGTLLAYVGATLVFDFEHPDTGNKIMVLFEAVIWNMLLQGVFQPIGALFTGFVCCPLASLFVIMFGLLRRGGRALWDTFMYYAVVKPRGRVPASDGFIARRTAGPGLASNYFFQIKPEQALAALEAKMEILELDSWRVHVDKKIVEPKQDFIAFVDQFFKPFSGTITNAGVYLELTTETEGLQKKLNIAVSNRRQKLSSTGLKKQSVKNKIKLPSKDLKLILLYASKMVEHFFPQHIIGRLTISEQDFWEDRQLEENDWMGLASKLFEEIFSPGFLVPLEETNTSFHLDVQHLNLQRYAGMLRSTDFRDDLDVVTIHHIDAGDVQVDTPYLDESVFDPSGKEPYSNLATLARHSNKPWKKPRWIGKEQSKLEIPPPVPHPGVIAIVMYNRENDQDLIDMSDIMCQQILKAAEHTPYHIAADPMAISTEMDASTPDRTITSTPDFDSPRAHLAKPERAFSDDNVNLNAIEEDVPETREESSEGNERLSLEGYGEMYSENEYNTSCMISIDEIESIESQV